MADRTTEAWMDAARAWLRATGEDHKTDALSTEGRALISASREIETEEDVAAALRCICWWDSDQVAEALAEIDSEVRDGNG